jgi:hypothetical protein
MGKHCQFGHKSLLIASGDALPIGTASAEMTVAPKNRRNLRPGTPNQKARNYTEKYLLTFVISLNHEGVLDMCLPRS